MYKKRLFIALMTGSLILLGALVVMGSYLLINDGSPWSRMMLLAAGMVLAGFFLVLGFGIIFLVISLWREKTTPSFQNLIEAAVHLLFPFAITIGRFFGIDQEQIKSSFISVNNQLVRFRAVKVNPGEIMILAPHCLQRTTCKHKITVDVDNCHRCGQCTIDSLLKIKDSYGINLAVATGGTLARSFVKKYRPRAIVAIACERDLTSGIQDTGHLPVFGIVNIRPEGPCFNTSVNLAMVEDAVTSFLRLEKSERPVQRLFDKPLLGKS